MSGVYTRHLISARELLVPKPEPDKNWRDRALCADQLELFLADFDHKQIAQQRRNEQKTQAICLACPVRSHCLWFALEQGEHYFMWGGLNPDQRRWVRRQLKMREERVA